jgi:hypothetical protein
VFGVAMMLDEVDVAEGVCRHMADEVDELIVADNGSTDGTREVLDRLARELPLTVVDDPVPAYLQLAKMSALADRAHAEGAEWVVPFDADELWISRAGRLREVLPGLPYPITHASLINHLRTRLDRDDPDPFRSMVWRQPEPQKLGKVAVRWQIGARLHQGNHGVDLPTGEVGGLQVLEIHHFPVRSAAHLIRKAQNGSAAYRAAAEVWPDMPADWGRHWKAWGALLEAHGPEALREAYTAHWWYGSPVDAGLVEDPAPYMRWQPG